MELLSNLLDGCNPLCRGCSHREYSKEQSLAQKQSFVQKTLSSWVDLINPIISVDEEKRWGYRTSVTLSAQWDGHKWLFGTKSLDEVIPIHRCPIHHPLVNRTIEVLSSSLPPYSSFPLAYLSMSKAQCTLVVKQKGTDNLLWFTDETLMLGS